MARRYSHRPLFPNPVVSFFLFWLGYILNGSTLPPSVTFCTARYESIRSDLGDGRLGRAHAEYPHEQKRGAVAHSVERGSLGCLETGPPTFGDGTGRVFQSAKTGNPLENGWV